MQSSISGSLSSICGSIRHTQRQTQDKEIENTEEKKFVTRGTEEMDNTKRK